MSLNLFSRADIRYGTVHRKKTHREQEVLVLHIEECDPIDSILSIAVS